MKTLIYEDGSEGYVFEVGDFVEITKDQHISGTKGEWGKVYKVSQPASLISFLSIQLAGYSRSKESFFASAVSVPSWQVKPHKIQMALKALNELPNVCQSVGKWELLASKCNIDSKLGRHRWKQRDKLLAQVDELKYCIRVVLKEHADKIRHK
jgi:hypothetical protein